MNSLSNEEAEGFFTNLVASAPAPSAEHVPEVKKGRIRGDSLADQNVEHVSKNMNWNEGVEKIIKQSILIGNLEEAVDCCLKVGRSVFIKSI